MVVGKPASRRAPATVSTLPSGLLPISPTTVGCCFDQSVVGDCAAIDSPTNPRKAANGPLGAHLRGEVCRHAGVVSKQQYDRRWGTRCQRRCTVGLVSSNRQDDQVKRGRWQLVDDAELRPQRSTAPLLESKPVPTEIVEAAASRE